MSTARARMRRIDPSSMNTLRTVDGRRRTTDYGRWGATAGIRLVNWAPGRFGLPPPKPVAPECPGARVPNHPSPPIDHSIRGRARFLPQPVVDGPSSVIYSPSPAVTAATISPRLSYAPIFEQLVRLFQRGGLLLARLTPGGPEIDQHHLAALVGEANLLAREGVEGEVRRLHANADRALLATDESEAQQGQQPQHKGPDNHTTPATRAGHGEGLIGDFIGHGLFSFGREGFRCRSAARLRSAIRKPTPHHARFFTSSSRRARNGSSLGIGAGGLVAGAGDDARQLRKKRKRTKAPSRKASGGRT